MAAVKDDAPSRIVTARWHKDSTLLQSQRLLRGARRAKYWKS
jgi:hypothetical protein